MDMKNVGLYLLIWVNVFLLVKAQVNFSPDPEEVVELQVTPLTPPVNVTTVQCYSSAPNFKVQYARVSDNKSVYDIMGSPVDNGATNSCAGVQRQFRLQLSQIRFLANPALVGGTFRLKVILDNNDQNATLSRRTFTFVAPFNLTGSSVSAVRNFDFTWTCHVTSDYPVIDWYRNTTNVGQVGIVNDSCKVNSLNNDSYIYDCQQTHKKYTLTIPGSSLTEELQGSTWRCKEAAGVLKGSKFMELDVLYPPTVTLYLQNTTEKAVDHIIKCTAVGKPNNATIITLQQRIGSILVRNITSFTQSSPGNMTLNIGSVSYQDMGTYTCLASNGIPDRNNNMKIQSNAAYLDVVTSSKFQLEQYTTISDINTQAIVSIPFYRNPPATESDVVWTKNTDISDETLKASANFSFSLNDTDIQRTFHGVDITLRGQSAIMTITSFQSYYEGNYTLKIMSAPQDFEEVTIALIRSGPPDTPTKFILLTRKETSIVFAWNKGSDGGHPQTFAILYREKISEVYRYTHVQDNSANINISHDITGLQSDTNYVFILYSFNEKGNSSGLKRLEERTLKTPEESSPSSLNVGIVGGAAGGGTVVLVVIIVIIIVVRRRRNKERKANEFNSSETLAGPKRQNIDNEDGDGLKDNPLYGGSPSGGASAVQGARAASENPSLYAEVVKHKKNKPVKEDKKPPPIYAEVNKSKKTNDKGEQYQNMDGFKQNGSADKQKAKENEQQGYRNKDGLFYMDVKFDQPPTRAKPTIRKEEQTGYAMIQFDEPNAKSTPSNRRGAEGGR